MFSGYPATITWQLNSIPTWPDSEGEQKTHLPSSREFRLVTVIQSGKTCLVLSNHLAIAFPSDHHLAGPHLTALVEGSHASD